MKEDIILVKLIVFLIAVFSTSCITSRSNVAPEYTREATIECQTYCHGPGNLLYRNDKTYFCHCFNGEIVVVSKTGTIYK